MSLIIEKPGLLSTVQDRGRHGHRRFGINPGGVMDHAAARIANILAGNRDGAALLEMHFPAPEILFESDVVIAIAGADFAGEMDGEAVKNWSSYRCHAGSRLVYRNRKSGNRAYLAVRGDLTISQWLGSSSTNLSAAVGGLEGRKLRPGDRIGLTASGDLNVVRGFVSPSLLPFYRPFPTVRIVAGGEWEDLGSAGREAFLSRDFTISNSSNRMGFRLTGEPIVPARARELVSSAVSFGTIQLLPGGQLIVLMADHQTTGGYPRIAHVITRDLPLIAQLGGGDKVAFHLIDVAEAEELAAEFERELNLLRVAAMRKITA